MNDEGKSKIFSLDSRELYLTAEWKKNELDGVCTVRSEGDDEISELDFAQGTLVAYREGLNRYISSAPKGWNSGAPPKKVESLVAECDGPRELIDKVMEQSLSVNQSAS